MKSNIAPKAVKTPATTFLLRMWRDEREAPEMRIIMQDVRTNHRWGFTTLSDLSRFLDKYLLENEDGNSVFLMDDLNPT